MAASGHFRFHALPRVAQTSQRGGGAYFVINTLKYHNPPSNFGSRRLVTEPLILTLLDAKWRHVNTHDYPADILSRGSSTTNLNISHLWWEGPPWLRLPPEQCPPPQFTVLTELPETKAVTLLAPALPSQQFWETFSSFTTLVRTYAWVRRFAANARLPAEKSQLTPHLTAEECHSTKRLFFRLV